MDILLTILIWSAGLFAFWVLTLGMIFLSISEQESILKDVILGVCAILIFGLFYLAFDSIFLSSDDVPATVPISTEQPLVKDKIIN